MLSSASLANRTIFKLFSAKPLRLRSYEVLDSIFGSLFTEEIDKVRREKIQLVQTIVTNEIKNYHWRKSQTGPLISFIDNIPKSLSIQNRLEFTASRLSKHYAQPAITVHPTLIFSNKVLLNIYKLTTYLVAIDNNSSDASKLNIIKEIIHNLTNQSMLPEKSLTPDEEYERGLFIYTRILEEYPEFLKHVCERFHATHGGNLEEITEYLRRPVMMSFQNVFSWTKGDADGNDETTAKTMERTLPAQQIAIIRIYLKALDEIRSDLPIDTANTVNNTVTHYHEYLTRCITAIEKGIWFDVEGSDDLTTEITDSIKLHLTDMTLSQELKNKLSNLSALIELAGFAGGLKEFVRQTTTVNVSVFDDLFNILSNLQFPEIQNILKGATGKTRQYSQLNDNEKAATHRLLQTNPIYFDALRENKNKFSIKTNKEIERLAFIMRHLDLFPFYIFSDTKSFINMQELRLLMHFSQFLLGLLRIGKIRRFPLQNLPLCETPQDIDNISNIVRDMLNDKQMRKRIAELGILTYVGGPSDLGKTGGIFTHVQLLFAQMYVTDILEEYKLLYPELKHVKLRVLHGFGGDMKRRIGSARQLHATNQGAEAYYNLAAPGAYSYFLQRVAGFPSEADYKVQELRLLKIKHPEAFSALNNAIKYCIRHFEDFIKDDNTKIILEQLSYADIEKAVNTSSRAGSKSNLNNVMKSRAIGFLNHFILSGIPADYFMGLMGLKSLPEDDKQHLHLLFKTQTVLKDIIYKTIYSIATSDFTRAKEKLSFLNINLFNVSNHTFQSNMKIFNYWKSSAIDVLAEMIHFLEPNCANSAKVYYVLNYKRVKYGEISLNEFTLGLMENMGPDFIELAEEAKSALPHFNQLGKCLTMHLNSPNTGTKENATLACRGVQNITAGPNKIADVQSSLRHQVNSLMPHHFEEQPTRKFKL